MAEPFHEGRPDPDEDSEEYEEYAEMFGNTPADVNPHEDDQIEDDNGDDCEIYAQYLQIYQEQSRNGTQPLDHEDFHLLEAELEMLVRLEQEFGRLLQEQERRKLDLADQLFIDPNSLADYDWDMSDGEDYEDPPFWQN